MGSTPGSALRIRGLSKSYLVGHLRRRPHPALRGLNLDVEQIIPSHGNLTTLQEARKIMDLHQSTDVWTK